MKTVDQLADIVHGRGGKVTPQRLVIYQILQHDTSHPTAEVLWSRVRAILPTVSLTTVYKTLNELVAIGELKRFDVNGVTHFDPDLAPHAEAVCLSCQSIVDVPSTIPHPAAIHVAGFEVVRSSLALYGYCAACTDQNKSGMRQPLTAEDSRGATESAVSTRP